MSTLSLVHDPNETADSLNNDLTKIHDWATKWLVTFNAQKTETMTISRKIDKPDQYHAIGNWNYLLQLSVFYLTSNFLSTIIKDPAFLSVLIFLVIQYAKLCQKLC
jgi:hypothetical protein